MSKHISASNAVVGAVLNAAALFGVQGYRMQSRQFTVAGEEGRPRPMFMGQWDDRFGTHHYAGMSDVLLSPKIKITPTVRVATVLWCRV